MKPTKVILALTLTACFISLPFTAFGDEVLNETKESPIAVEIVTSPLMIGKVEVPRFGKNLTVHQEKQTIIPESDLIIRVEDNRDHKQTPWGIHYQLSLFKNDKSRPLSGLVMDLKKGTLKADNHRIESSTAYEPQAVHIQGEGTQSLVNTIQGTATNYEYRVNKKDITLELPKGLQKGTYTAIQTVTLVNSSIAE